MTKPAVRISDQVVLITGGARGIGAETAKALARRGAKVVLTDVDQPALDATVAAIGEDKALGVYADVTDLSSMEEAVAAGLEKFGRLDSVLANAGIASYGSVLAVDPATFKRVVDINITGVFNTVRAALPAVLESKGYVLVVSSLAAFAPAPSLTAYTASKAGAENLASALRIELAHQGVAVGSAHMSWIDTPLVQDAKSDLPAFQQMLSKMPYPLSKTTDVDACVKAFVAGIEGRKRRVYCPGWVRFVGWLKPVVTSPVGERTQLEHVPTLLPQIDAQVAAMGRSTSKRNAV